MSPRAQTNTFEETLFQVQITMFVILDPRFSHKAFGVIRNYALGLLPDT